MSAPKKMGLINATLIQSNGMIGAGIVGIPSIIIQTTGSIGLLSFLLCVLLILCMTYALGELSIEYGGDAWSYRFPCLWGSHPTGILASSFYIIGLHIALGFVAQQAGIWLNEIVPYFSIQLLSLLSIGLLALFIYIGKDISSLWQYIISAVIIFSVLLTSFICFSKFNKQIFFADFSFSFHKILEVIPIVLYSFMGFETITSMYSLIKNPKKNVFRGGIYGVLLVAGLYILFSSSILGAIPSDMFAQMGQQSLVKVIKFAFPEYRIAPLFIYLGGLFAILGTLHSMLWSVNCLIMSIYKVIIHRKNTVLSSWPSKLNSNLILICSSIAIFLSSAFFKSENILYITTIFIGLAYTFSVIPLIKIKQKVKFLFLIYVISLGGTSLIIFFSIKKLVF